MAALGAATATAGCVTVYAGRTSDDGEVETPILAEHDIPPIIYGEEPSPSDIRAVDDPAFGPGDAWPADPDGCRLLEVTAIILGLEGGIGLEGGDVACACPPS